MRKPKKALAHDGETQIREKDRQIDKQVERANEREPSERSDSVVVVMKQE